MKHVDYWNEYRSSSYFEDVTVFACESEAEYNETLEKYRGWFKLTHYDYPPILEEKDAIFLIKGEKIGGFVFTERNKGSKLTTIFIKCYE